VSSERFESPRAGAVLTFGIRIMDGAGGYQRSVRSLGSEIGPTDYESSLPDGVTQHRNTVHCNPVCMHMFRTFDPRGLRLYSAAQAWTPGLTTISIGFSIKEE
jgi:hypothetical protein